jgi:hypothetical protein
MTYARYRVLRLLGTSLVEHALTAYETMPAGNFPLDPATQHAWLIDFEHVSAFPLPFHVYNTDNRLSALLNVERGDGETLVARFANPLIGPRLALWPPCVAEPCRRLGQAQWKFACEGINSALYICRSAIFTYNI